MFFVRRWSDSTIDPPVRAFCAERLARHKRPTTIHVLAEMPRDPNGKLYKARLRELEGAQG